MVVKIKLILLYTSLAIIMFFLLFPYAWLVDQSFMPYKSLTSYPPHFIPESLINYEMIINPDIAKRTGAYAYSTPAGLRHIGRSIINSAIVAIPTVFITLLLASLSAYTFSKMRFRGRDGLLTSTIGVRLLPTASIIIPLYIMINFLQLIDNMLSLIILYTVMLLPYNIWMLTTFFQTIPMDLNDAARVDGCTRLQTLTKIILPLARPGLIAVGIFNFLVSWNEFFTAFILTRTAASYTLPVIIAMFTAVPQMVPYDFMITVGVIGTLPPIILVLIFNKYLIKGLLMGAIK